MVDRVYKGVNVPPCEWPQVAYCGCSGDTSPAHNKCGCRAYNNFTCGVACGTVQSCTPNKCPSGWVSCGTSGSKGVDGEGCVAKTSCKGKCSGCSNEFVVKRYCKPKELDTCDGGGWTNQPTSVEEGGKISFAGYGEDTGGIDSESIVIEIDGNEVNQGSIVLTEEETITNWSVTASGFSEGDHSVEVSWADNEGNTGDECSLTASFTVTPEEKTNPDWEIAKTGTPSCQEGETDDLDYVEVIYSITVTNSGEGEGNIIKIADNLDDKVEEAFLDESSITSGAEYSDGELVWDFGEEGITFDARESRMYSYKVSVPRESFGIYTNTVTATPSEGDSFSANAVIQANCSTTEEIPDTGLFEDPSTKIYLGLCLLGFGMLYMKFDFFQLMFNFVETGKKKRVLTQRIKERKKIISVRKSFERKLGKKRRRFS